MFNKKAVKRTVSLICAVILCMSYTISAYAITYNVSVPTVTTSNTSTNVIYKLTRSVTASSATWLVMKHYCKYTLRGSYVEYQTDIKSYGGGSVRTASLNETSSFVEIIGSGKTYTKAYNEGWYGVSSNNFVLYKRMMTSMN